LLEDSLKWQFGCAFSHSMSKYESPVTVFSEKKNRPINLSCISRSTRSLWDCLSSTHMWHESWLPQMLQLRLFTTPMTWNVASSEKHIRRRKSGDTSILFSMYTAKYVRATWSLGFGAWIILILYAPRWSLLCSTSFTVEREIDLRGLRWNASLTRLTFSSEVRVFPGGFTRNTLSAVLSSLSRNQKLFCVGSRRPYYVLKRRWAAVRDSNCSSHKYALNVFLCCPHRYWAHRRSSLGACA
jgi:hypothetical protein